MSSGVHRSWIKIAELVILVLLVSERARSGTCSNRISYTGHPRIEQIEEQFGVFMAGSWETKPARCETMLLLASMVKDSHTLRLVLAALRNSDIAAPKT
jgi:hypothetical protein